MHKILSFVFLILLCASCNKDSSTSPSTNNNNNPTTTEYGNISGIVKSVSTNSPVSGVVVSCAGISATTLSDGAFQLTNVPTGQQTISASKSGYEAYSSTISVSKSSNSVNIQLTTSTSTASIDGIIRDAESNQGLSNVKVTIAGMTDYTDASGHYQLPTVPQGQQTITAELSNYDNYSGTTYLYSWNKKFDIIMTWKMPRMSSATISKTDKGQPTCTFPYSATAKTYVKNYQVSVSANGVKDAKGISKVEFHYYYNYVKLDNHTGNVEVYAFYIDTQEGIVNVPLTSTNTYSLSFLVGVQTLTFSGNPGFAGLFELLNGIQPKIIVTDNDGNTITQTLNW